MPTLTAFAPVVNISRADLATADRLAFLADGGDPDSYYAGWEVIEPEDDAVESAYDQWLAEHADELADDAAGEALIESIYRPF